MRRYGDPEVIEMEPVTITGRVPAAETMRFEPLTIRVLTKEAKVGFILSAGLVALIIFGGGRRR